MRYRAIKIGERYIAGSIYNSIRIRVLVLAKWTKDEVEQHGWEDQIVCLNLSTNSGVFLAPVNILGTINKLEADKRAAEAAAYAARWAEEQERMRKYKATFNLINDRLEPWAEAHGYEEPTTGHIASNGQSFTIDTAVVKMLLDKLDSARESYEICLSDSSPLPELAKDVVRGFFATVFK